MKRFWAECKVVFRVMWNNKQAKIGIIVLSILICFALLGPVLIGEVPANYGERFLGPSLKHPLGTDFTGRDTLLQFILGTRDVMLIALFSGLFTIFFGTLVGIIAGYSGGRLDEFLMLVTNVMLTVPSFPVLMVLSLVINAGNPVTFGLLLSIWGWAGLARSVRSQVIALRESEFVAASNMLGMSTKHIIINDIFPSLIPYVAVNFVLIMRSSILASVGLMMLGLAPFKGEHWGIMLNLSMTKSGAMFGSSAMIYLITPILGIILFQTSCFMFSKGLEDAFNPRLRSEMSE